MLISSRLLQARLQLDYLSTAKNDRQIKDMVQNLPDGLDYTYEALLCSTAAHYPTRIHEMRLLLRCLACAASPLSASQLSEIMAMQPGERYIDFDSVMTDPYDALEVIAPFVTIHREHHSRWFIKLSHYSLDEYPCSERILRGRARDFHVDVREVNAWLTSVCLQCLTFSVFDNPLEDTNMESDPDGKHRYALLPYAALNWFGHMYKAKGLPDFEQRYQPYLSWFVNGDEGTTCYNAWQQLYFEAKPHEECFNSPICSAILYSLDELFEYLLPMVPSIDHRFADGFTCLAVAAVFDNTAIARKLLDLGAYVDRTITGRELTPLHLAAEFGSSGVFDLLLDAGADPHARSRKRTTPFYRAARGGDIRILRRLKDCGSDVNASTTDKWTPIMEAVEHENQDVLQLLIEWGADLTVCSEEGDTPFTLAEDVLNSSILQLLQAASSGPGDEGTET
jgi:ankyrin repeat protein